MTTARRYTTGVRAALVALSRGTCYRPQCERRIVTFVDDEPLLDVEIAHIHGLRAGSARYNSAMTDRERNAFPNLILLCGPHHHSVDHHAEKWPAQVLRDWKLEAEARVDTAALGDADFTGLTERELERLLIAELRVNIDRLEQAVTRLEAIDMAAAKLLKPLLEDFAALQFRPQAISEDTVGLLAAAADRLAGLNLEDMAVLLNEASKQLERNLNRLADGY